MSDETQKDDLPEEDEHQCDDPIAAFMDGLHDDPIPAEMRDRLLYDDWSGEC